MTKAVWGDARYKYNDASRTWGLPARPDTDANIVRWAFEIDWDGDGVYSGATESHYVIGFKMRRGRSAFLNIDINGDASGFEPVRVGTGSIMLDDTTRRFDQFNTASPLYPNVRAGRFVRISNQWTDSEATPVFHGIITRITAKMSEEGRRVQIDFEDGMRFLQRADVNIPVNVTSTGDAEAAGLILDDVDWPVLFGRSLQGARTSGGREAMQYWNAKGKALAELRKLSDSFIAYLYVASNGNLVYKTPQHFTSGTGSIYTGADFLKIIDVGDPFETIRNYIKLTANPLEAQASGVLWTLGDILSLAAGASVEFWASYSYGSTPVSAINVLTPSFTANAAEDGSGADMTASFSATYTDFGNTAKITVTNNHATDTGYLTLLNISGEAITPKLTVSFVENDTASQATFGKSALIIDGKWMQYSNFTNDVSNWLIAWMPSAKKFLTVEMEGNYSAQFGMDLFGLMTLQIPSIDIDDNYVVAGIEHDWITDNGNATRTRYYLEPSPLVYNADYP